MNEAKAFYEMLERTGVVADFEARGEARGEAKAAEIIKSKDAALSQLAARIAELEARLAKNS